MNPQCTEQANCDGYEMYDGDSVYCTKHFLSEVAYDRLTTLEAENERLKSDLMRDSSQDFRRYSILRRHFHTIITQLGDPETAVRDINAMLDKDDASEIVESYVEALLRSFYGTPPAESTGEEETDG